MSLEPFRGLSPFSEKDADFFCGREDDVSSVKNMLLVHRLTVLHGVAGVGKTSFLRAGVTPAMKHEAERNRELWDSPGIGIIVFPQGENPVAWLDDPLGNFACSICEQIQALGLDAQPFDTNKSFGDFLKTNAALFDNRPHCRGRLFLILDQFELPLQRDERDVEEDEFFSSFAKVINAPEVPVHFLIALQSSDLGELERLEGLIPRIWEHRYELKHLGKEAATRAILEPIRRFNAQRPDCEAVTLKGFDLRLMYSQSNVSSIPTSGSNLVIVANVNDVLYFRIFDADGKLVVDTDQTRLTMQAGPIEDLKRQLDGLRPPHELTRSEKDQVVTAVTSIVDRSPLEEEKSFVDRVLADIRAESHDGRGPSSAWKIEAPYLQLVMQSLWRKEGIPEQSHVLHVGTYEALDRAEGIIQEHVAQTMVQLTQTERDAAARFLHQLLIFARPVQIAELVAHANEARKRWQPELREELVRHLFEGPLTQKRILRPAAHGLYESFLPTLRKPLGKWVRRQKRLDGLPEEIASAEALFKCSQLDGLRQAANAALFALQEIQGHKVCASEVPTPLLIGTLKRMLNQVTESRRLTDQDSPLNSMSYSSDGKWLAAASFNGRIHLLNRENGEERLIQDRNGAVLNVALGPGERIAIASGHGYARILDFDGKELRQFPESPPQERSPCYCVAFSADGKRLATGSLDGVARIWDIDRGECIECHGHQLTTHVVTFSPTEPILLTMSWDATARLWNAAGKQICKYQVDGKFIHQGEFSRRGDLVATVCWTGGLAHIWNIGDEKPLRELQTRSDHLTHICFVDPDGRRVAAASWDGVARTWDIEESSVTEKETCHFVPGPMFRACFSPEGRELATNPWDGAVHLWNLVESPQAKGQEESKSILQTPGEVIMSARFSPSGGQFAVVGFDKKIQLYSLGADPLNKGGVKLDLLVEKDSLHRGPLTSVAFGPSRSGRLATASYDGTGRLWFLDGDRLKEGPCLRGHQAQIYEITLSPREPVVATASMDGSVRFWNLSGEQKEQFTGVGIVWSAKFHPRGNLVASAWGDGSIRLIDISGKQLGEYRPPGSSSPAFCVDFSDDGHFLGAVFGNGTACAWECCECCDSPETWLAREPRRPPFQVHEGVAMGIAFSPGLPGSEPWFATSSGDGLIRLWSLNGRRLAEFKQHEDIVRAIDFNPDPTSLQLLTGCVDGTAKLLTIDRSIESLQDLHRQARKWLGDRLAEETGAADRSLASRS